MNELRERLSVLEDRASEAGGGLPLEDAIDAATRPLARLIGSKADVEELARLDGMQQVGTLAWGLACD